MIRISRPPLGYTVLCLVQSAVTRDQTSSAMVRAPGPVISMVTTSDQRSCHRHDHWPGRLGFLPTVTPLVGVTSEDSALFPGLPSCFPQVVVSQQTLDVNFMRIFPPPP